jgi:acyl dehydratase
VVLITGAGRGLGRAHALACAALGARIVVNDYGGSRDGVGASFAPALAVVEEIHDKGSGALVVRSTMLTTGDGRPLATGRTGQFIRGEGGFGGDPGPKFTWTVPDRPADHSVLQPTRPDQALLYRLSGDRNPLHSDPIIAGRAGFDRPILHGMCIFGFVGRAILALAGHDPARFKALKARFAKPVFPGETLRSDMWIDGGTIRFRSFVGDRLALDAGEAEIA